MKHINYIELTTYSYYGDHLGVSFNERDDYILEKYQYKKDYGCYYTYFGDGSSYYFVFEDNGNSFSVALNNLAKLMKRENIFPEIKYADVADLSRLMSDTNLGNELYLNFKTNSQYYVDLCVQRIKDVDGLLTSQSTYFSSNSVCFFGNRNMLDLIQTPSEFKNRIVKYSFEHKLNGVLKYLGFSDKEIKTNQLKIEKRELKKRIKSLESQLDSAKKRLSKLEKEIDSYE